MMISAYKTNPPLLFFKGLANDTRLAIIQVLKNGPKPVGEICETLGFEQNRVSHNLRCLEFCGFVSSERTGKKRIYSLNDETIAPLMQIVDNHIKTYGQNLMQCKVLRR